MTSMNISLPESLRSFVEEQVETEGYGTASEYIRELLREAKRKKEDKRIEALLIEGLDSGPAIEVTPEWWEQFKSEAIERYKNRKGK